MQANSKFRLDFQVFVLLFKNSRSIFMMIMIAHVSPTVGYLCLDWGSEMYDISKSTHHHWFLGFLWVSPVIESTYSSAVLGA